MIGYVKTILAGQFEASLCMMNDCIAKCPLERWGDKVAKYPFWQVAYHTLCFVDLYLSPGEGSFKFRDLHPKGWSEFEDEYPSRRFEKHELARYAEVCRHKASVTLAAETRESLEGGSGFPRLPFSRGELHLYNIRHLQHHTGQLSATLRRGAAPGDDGPKWVKTGWK